MTASKSITIWCDGTATSTDPERGPYSHVCGQWTGGDKHRVSTRGPLPNASWHRTADGDDLCPSCWKDRQTHAEHRPCSACGAKCRWSVNAWVCTRRSCGSEWYPDHGDHWAAPRVNA